MFFFRALQKDLQGLSAQMDGIIKRVNEVQGVGYRVKGVGLRVDGMIKRVITLFVCPACVYVRASVRACVCAWCGLVYCVTGLGLGLAFSVLGVD
jgi:hypothetical protein